MFYIDLSNNYLNQLTVIFTTPVERLLIKMKHLVFKLKAMHG